MDRTYCGPVSDDLEYLAARKYLLLTTYRRDGTPVGTPVWVVRDGDHLLVVTDASTGKVKRLRHTARVRLVPCGVLGRVRSGSTPVDGVAEIVDDAAVTERTLALVRRRYHVMYPVALLYDWVRRQSTANELTLRITV